MAATRIDASGKLSTATTHVSFVCQKCHQPLRLDTTFNALGQSVLSELRAPLMSNSDDGRDSITQKFQQLSPMQYEEDPNVSKLTVLPSRSDLEESGFTLLGETDIGNSGNLSHRLKVCSALYDFMSGQSEMDHPLCEECTDHLLDRLDQELKQTEDECRDYREFLDKLNESDDGVDEAALDKELEQLRAEEEKLIQELERVEEEQQKVDQLIVAEKEETQRLEESEAKYYRDYAELKRSRIELADDQLSVENQMQFATTQLNKLKQVNVLNSTFHIWHNGHFGTINGFRLGRLPNIQVEWSEINAAWGQAALLLHSLARKVDLTFRKYKLVPYGSYSYIENLEWGKRKKKDEPKEFTLYASGGFKFFWDTKFDLGMAAFLNCLEQLWEKINDGNNMPYAIYGDRLQDRETHNSFSIKTQFNCEEQWTKALKFMLTNLKWCLSWIQAQGAKLGTNN
ncbi:beclin-1-like [Babylonia areolata]|uniref:beclin-1-like n=1 Tax=Babylonia areolata TaxID=304850 RepID=UPI003FD40417